MSNLRKRIALAMIAVIGIVLSIAILYRRSSGPPAAQNARRHRPEKHLPPDPFARTEQANVVEEPDAHGDLVLEGLVLDADSQPAPGATVVIDARPRRVIEADETGQFTISGLSAREYAISAAHGDEVAGPLRVRVTPDVDPVVINLRKGAELSVKVVAANTGKPVERATVQLRGPMPTSVVTDANGEARLVALPLGEQRVVAWADGLGHGEAPVFFGDDQRALAITLSLGEGGTVSGRVADPAGAPISGARVTLESAAEPWWHAADAEDAVTTDAEGKFLFSSVTLGSYRARAAHPDFVSDTSPMFTVGSQPSIVEVELRHGVAVKGTVVDERGAAVAGARVRLTPRGVRGNPREAWTDTHGAFAIRGLAPGHVDIAATTNDATSPIIALDVPTGGLDSVEVVLSNGADIEGTVVDDHGEPLEGIQVTAWQENGSSTWWDLVSFRRELTSSDGKFRLTGLATSETYSISADRVETIARGLGMRSQRQHVAAGSRDVRIVMAAPGRVQGKVAYTDGGHPSVFSVRLTGSVRQTRPFTDGTGTFAIEEIPPGEYILIVQGPGFESFRFDGIKIAAGAVTDLGTVPVRPGRRIEGRVVDGQGRPVAGAKVEAGHVMISTGRGDADQGMFAGRSRATETDAEGQFALAGVGRGSVTLVASHPGAGTSVPVELVETQESIQHVELTVVAQAAITGKVTANGSPVANTLVTAQSATAPLALQMVQTGSDGRYRFDRVASASYAVSVGIGTPMTGMKFVGRRVVVKPAETVTADLTPATGPGSIAVTTSFTNGDRKVVMLFTTRGELAATNVSQVLHAVIDRSDIFWAWSAGMSDTPAVVSGLPVGHYTTCAVPFAVSSGALPDLASLMRQTDLPARCQGVDVGAAQVALSIPIDPV